MLLSLLKEIRDTQMRTTRARLKERTNDVFVHGVATTTPATNKNHNNENTRPEQKRTGRRRQSPLVKTRVPTKKRRITSTKTRTKTPRISTTGKTSLQLRLLHKERRSRSVPTILGSLGTTGEDTGLYTCSLARL